MTMIQVNCTFPILFSTYFPLRIFLNKLLNSTFPFKTIQQKATEVEFNAALCPWILPNQYDWIYMSSALLVLAANLVFLLQIMWVLITKLRSATSQETQQSRKAAKALVVLMPLLGITYVLVITGPKNWPLFEHTRAFCLSTQVFFSKIL